MRIRVYNLVSALNSLKEYYIMYKSSGCLPSLEESCIKSFRYTLGMSCKTMKKLLERFYNISAEELTIDKTFITLQNYNLVPDYKRWINYCNICNEKGYNPAKSKELLPIIPKFIQDMELLIRNIDNVR